jgi:hypothetical protein
MSHITVTIDSGEGEPEEIQLPASWHICSHCSGGGKSSAYLGSFTRESLNEDPDFAEEYMNGGYDRPCEACSGSGKVLLIDEDRCITEDQKRALKHQRDQEEYEHESYQERKMESLMLGESRPEDWY